MKPLLSKTCQRRIPSEANILRLADPFRTYAASQREGQPTLGVKPTTQLSLDTKILEFSGYGTTYPQ